MWVNSLAIFSHHTNLLNLLSSPNLTLQIGGPKHKWHKFLNPVQDKNDQSLSNVRNQNCACPYEEKEVNGTFSSLAVCWWQKKPISINQRKRIRQSVKAWEIQFYVVWNEVPVFLPLCYCITASPSNSSVCMNPFSLIVQIWLAWKQSLD